MSDDIKKAAEIEIAVNDKGDRSVYFARAYLAIREQVETVALPAMRDGLALMNKTGGLTAHIIGAELDAAIKAIEEGRA